MRVNSGLSQTSTARAGVENWWQFECVTEERDFYSTVAYPSAFQPSTCHMGVNSSRHNIAYIGSLYKPMLGSGCLQPSVTTHYVTSTSGWMLDRPFVNPRRQPGCSPERSRVSDPMNLSSEHWVPVGGRVIKVAADWAMTSRRSVTQCGSGI